MRVRRGWPQQLWALDLALPQSKIQLRSAAAGTETVEEVAAEEVAVEMEGSTGGKATPTTPSNDPAVQPPLEGSAEGASAPGLGLGLGQLLHNAAQV